MFFYFVDNVCFDYLNFFLVYVFALCCFVVIVVTVCLGADSGQ